MGQLHLALATSETDPLLNPICHLPIIKSRNSKSINFNHQSIVVLSGNAFHSIVRGYTSTKQLKLNRNFLNFVNCIYSIPQAKLIYSQIISNLVPLLSKHVVKAEAISCVFKCLNWKPITAVCNQYKTANYFIVVTVAGNLSDKCINISVTMHTTQWLPIGKKLQIPFFWCE